MTDRQFTLVGERCIFCDDPCIKRGTSEPHFARLTTRIQELGVEVSDGEEWVGDNRSKLEMVDYCWFGEAGKPYTILRPDLKQTDGTPRVCLNYQTHPIRDAVTKEEIIWEGIK